MRSFFIRLQRLVASAFGHPSPEGLEAPLGLTPGIRSVRDIRSGTFYLRTPAVPRDRARITMNHNKTLSNMSPETPGNPQRGRGRQNRTVLLTFRVTPEERDAIRAAAKWENKTVARFLRAAIAVRARDGFSKRDQE